ncbi:hypothetical protein [Flaviaesturariibacter amylovorans]|uniref:Uncharacterized protein n=1 Tax=Flaviaesturariibacter amylovorans TaxID=1084520 RepID=A0ABP8GKR8_9BACT
MNIFFNDTYGTFIIQPDPMFPRHNYYSQTEVLTKYQISQQAYKKLLQDQGIEPVSKTVDLGGYPVTTCYVEKEKIDALNLPIRLTKPK